MISYGVMIQAIKKVKSSIVERQTRGCMVLLRGFNYINKSLKLSLAPVFLRLDWYDLESGVSSNALSVAVSVDSLVCLGNEVEGLCNKCVELVDTVNH